VEIVVPINRISDFIDYVHQLEGKHGIGLSKRVYYLENTDPENLYLMRGIKAVFDPKNVLNPGKVYQ
ncbi:MAG: hypothetical protein LBT14_07140, partial [Treponema sp.]|jgi:glycolate oxidase|nr:hypothetical protein [Treponema sp.]